MTRCRTHMLFTTTVAALFVSAALSGCTTGEFAGSGGSPAAGGATPPTTPASASGLPQPSAQATFTIPTTCLPATKVSALLGLPVSGPTMTADSGSLICTYLTPAHKGANIDYESMTGASPASLAANLASSPPEDATVTPISNLGDAAYELTASAGEGIIVLSGSIVITITTSSPTLPGVESLARAVLAG